MELTPADSTSRARAVGTGREGRLVSASLGQARPDQARSNRSRFITLAHAAHEVSDELLLRVVAGVHFGDRPQLRVRADNQVDSASGHLGRP